MNEKREWYMAEWFDPLSKKWRAFAAILGTANDASGYAMHIPTGRKARIVKHTTEVVEEREARG